MVASPTHPPHFTPQKHYSYFYVSGTHFCYRLCKPQGLVRPEASDKLKKSPHRARLSGKFHLWTSSVRPVVGGRQQRSSEEKSCGKKCIKTNQVNCVVLTGISFLMFYEYFQAIHPEKQPQGCPKAPSLSQHCIVYIQVVAHRT
jgi:hypothetical protein